MNLDEAIDQVKSIEGYQHHRERATDHSGTVKCYTFWFEKNDEMRDYEVRFLVIDEGEPGEAALVYSTKHIQPETELKEAMIVAIDQYRVSHPELEYYEITNVNEWSKLGRVTAYIYDEAQEHVVPEEYLVWDEAGVIKRRKIGSVTI